MRREDLARLAGISTGSLANYLNDRNVPSASVLLRIATALAERLQMTPDELWVGLGGLLGVAELGRGGAMHPHERLVREGFEAFAQGDLDRIRAVFAEDAVYHIPREEFLGGTYRGLSQITGLFSKLMDASEGTFQVELHDVVASDEHTLAITIRRAEREGAMREVRDVTVFHVRGGKIVEAWSHPLDQEAADEFWS